MPRRMRHSRSGRGLGQTPVPQHLRRHPQVQRRGFALAQVRRRLAHVPDQRDLQLGGGVEALAGRAFHAGVDERGQGGVVAGDAQPLQVVERVANALGAESRHAHQVVGGESLVRPGIDQSRGHAFQLAPIGLGDGGSPEACAYLLRRSHLQRRREHLHPVLLPCQQFRLLQPGHRGANAGIVRGGITLERLILVLAQDLSRGGHHLSPQAFLPVQLVQRPQNAVDLRPREA